MLTISICRIYLSHILKTFQWKYYKNLSWLIIIKGIKIKFHRNSPMNWDRIPSKFYIRSLITRTKYFLWAAISLRVSLWSCPTICSTPPIRRIQIFFCSQYTCWIIHLTTILCWAIFANGILWVLFKNKLSCIACYSLIYWNYWCNKNKDCEYLFFHCSRGKSIFYLKRDIIIL